MHSRAPQKDYLRVFGVIDYAHLSAEQRKKLDATSIRVRLLGCAEDSAEYIVQTMETNRFFYCRTFFGDEQASIKDILPKKFLSTMGDLVNSPDFVSKMILC